MQRSDASADRLISLGKYEIKRTLGRGAMGTVYEGWDPNISRRVAIKTVRLPDPADEEAMEELARFRREAQAAGRLTHPNLVGVYDYGEGADLAYIVMEFVDGKPLKSLLDAEERLALPMVRRVMDDLLAGLEYSHGQGVIHRDIKPANIMMTNSGQAKVADFGIARIESSSMTQAGTVLGTPAYMSPEQFMGVTVDLRTDVYSSGVLLYQLLTGEKPFEGSLTTIMHKVLNTVPPRPSELSVTAPTALDEVVATAMARRPEDRYPSAAAFRQAIHAALDAPQRAAQEAPARALPDEGGDATVISVPRPAIPKAAPSVPMPRPAAADSLAEAGTAVPALAGKRRGLPVVPLAAGGAAVLAVTGGIAWWLTRDAQPPTPVAATGPIQTQTVQTQTPTTQASQTPTTHAQATQAQPTQVPPTQVPPTQQTPQAQAALPGATQPQATAPGTSQPQMTQAPTTPTQTTPTQTTPTQTTQAQTTPTQTTQAQTAPQTQTSQPQTTFTPLLPPQMARNGQASASESQTEPTPPARMPAGPPAVLASRDAPGRAPERPQAVPPTQPDLSLSRPLEPRLPDAVPQTQTLASNQGPPASTGSTTSTLPTSSQVPIAPPPSPEEMRRASEGAFRDVPCTAAAAEVARDGRLTLRGVAGQGAPEAALRGKAQALRAPSLEWQVTAVEGPYCDALDLVRQHLRSPAEGGPLLALSGGRTELHQNDLIQPQVAAGSFPAFLQVDYISRDDNGAPVVVHMLSAAPARGRPYAARSQQVLGAARPRDNPPFNGWDVQPPFGTDLIVAVASSVPLVQTEQSPLVPEPAGPYLVRLRDSIALAVQRRGEVAASAFVLRTSQ